MAASTHRHQQFALARESDDARDVGNVGAARDQRRVFVDHPVPNAPRCGIALLIRGQQAAAKARPKILNRSLLDRRFGAGEFYCVQLARRRLRSAASGSKQVADR